MGRRMDERGNVGEARAVSECAWPKELIQTPGVHEAVSALGAEEDPVTLAY